MRCKKVIKSFPAKFRKKERIANEMQSKIHLSTLSTRDLI